MKENGENELGTKQAVDLVLADARKGSQAEVAFPAFEESFDAPAQAVELSNQVGRKPLIIGIGQEDGPGKKGVIGLGVIGAAIAMKGGAAAASIGDMLRQREGQKTEGQAVLGA